MGLFPESWTFQGPSQRAPEEHLHPVCKFVIQGF